MKRTPLDEAIGVPAGAAGVFLDVIGGMSSGKAIENQEKQGQKDACRTQALPIKGTSDKRDIWEKLGFIFGEPADDLFVNVTMPPGWELRPTDHSMHSNLHDEQGRVRASMFYKAAFYDRDASISLCRRFSVNQYDIQDGDSDNLIRVSVYDADAMRREPIHVIEHECADAKERYSKRDELGNEAKEWLSEAYPDWENPLAYW
jgi:hypothetical protein